MVTTTTILTSYLAVPVAPLGGNAALTRNAPNELAFAFARLHGAFSQAKVFSLALDFEWGFHFHQIGSALYFPKSIPDDSQTLVESDLSSSSVSSTPRPITSDCDTHSVTKLV